MMQNMQAYTLLRPMQKKNDLLENVTEYAPAGEILAAISTATGGMQEINQLQRIQSTHRALTPNDVRAGDKFGGYKVDFTIQGRVYRELFLTREDEAYEDRL